MRDTTSELDYLLTARHLPGRVRQDFAVLSSDDAGKLVLIRFEQLAEGEEDAGPPSERNLSPFDERPMRGCDRAVYILGRGKRNLRRGLAGGRVVNIAQAFGSTGRFSTVDPVTDLIHRPVP